MGLFDRLRGGTGRRGRARRGLDALNGQDIRNIVEHSLEETEATSEVVERAQDAHDRARDLMRQGLFEEALSRFREALSAWEQQAAICREQGFKNMWPGKPEQVGREMEDLRITHLDVIDPDTYDYLRKRAELRRELLAGVLNLARSTEGASEKAIFDAFPDHQREDIRGILFYAQSRGWLTRQQTSGRYAVYASDSAPDLD